VLWSVYWITAIGGVLALIGCWTRCSLLVFALGNVFMQAFYYSFGDMHHNQAALIIALGVLALAPSGAVLSVDAWRRRSGSAAGARWTRPHEARSDFARWPLLVTRWLLALIYGSAALSKLVASGVDWINGYTLQYYLLDDGLRNGMELGVRLGAYHLPVVVLSWVSMLFEGTFFLVLVAPRLAWVYLPVGIALHLGIYWTMKAPFFQFSVLYAAFVPWTRFGKALKDSWGSLRTTIAGEWLSRQQAVDR
jgi:hypothetical protein